MTCYYSFIKEHKIKLEVAKSIDKEISYKTMKQLKFKHCWKNSKTVTKTSKASHPFLGHLQKPLLFHVWLSLLILYAPFPNKSPVRDGGGHDLKLFLYPEVYFLNPRVNQKVLLRNINVNFYVT